LWEAFKCARIEGLDTTDLYFFRSLIEAIKDIHLEDVRKNFDLYFVYGFTICEKNPKKSELILKECLSSNFKPAYLVHYALAKLFGTLNDQKNFVINAKRAYELNPTDLLVIEEYIAALIMEGKLDIVEELSNKLSTSIYGHFSLYTHNQFIHIRVNKQDYLSVAKEFEKWMLTKKLKEYQEIAILCTYFLIQNKDRLVEIGESEIKSVSAKKLINKLSSTPFDNVAMIEFCKQTLETIYGLKKLC